MPTAFDITNGIKIGMRVRRTQGRELGRTGVVTFMSDPYVMGSAGDILVKVTADDGGADWTAYVRQMVAA